MFIPEPMGPMVVPPRTHHTFPLWLHNPLPTVLQVLGVVSKQPDVHLFWDPPTPSPLRDSALSTLCTSGAAVCANASTTPTSSWTLAPFSTATVARVHFVAPALAVDVGKDLPSLHASGAGHEPLRRMLPSVQVQTSAGVFDFAWEATVIDERVHALPADLPLGALATPVTRVALELLNMNAYPVQFISVCVDPPDPRVRVHYLAGLALPLRSSQRVALLTLKASAPGPIAGKVYFDIAPLPASSRVGPPRVASTDERTPSLECPSPRLAGRTRVTFSGDFLPGTLEVAPEDTEFVPFSTDGATRTLRVRSSFGVPVVVSTLTVDPSLFAVDAFEAGATIAPGESKALATLRLHAPLALGSGTSATGGPATFQATAASGRNNGGESGEIDEHRAEERLVLEMWSEGAMPLPSGGGTSTDGEANAGHTAPSEDAMPATSPSLRPLPWRLTDAVVAAPCPLPLPSPTFPVASTATRRTRDDTPAPSPPPPLPPPSPAPTPPTDKREPPLARKKGRAKSAASEPSLPSFPRGTARSSPPSFPASSPTSPPSLPSPEPPLPAPLPPHGGSAAGAAPWLLPGRSVLYVTTNAGCVAVPLRIKRGLLGIFVAPAVGIEGDATAVLEAAAPDADGAAGGGGTRQFEMVSDAEAASMAPLKGAVDLGLLAAGDVAQFGLLVTNPNPVPVELAWPAIVSPPPSPGAGKPAVAPALRLWLHPSAYVLGDERWPSRLELAAPTPSQQAATAASATMPIAVATGALAVAFNVSAASGVSDAYLAHAASHVVALRTAGAGPDELGRFLADLFSSGPASLATGNVDTADAVNIIEVPVRTLFGRTAEALALPPHGAVHLRFLAEIAGDSPPVPAPLTGPPAAAVLVHLRTPHETVDVAVSARPVAGPRIRALAVLPPPAAAAAFDTRSTSCGCIPGGLCSASLALAIAPSNQGGLPLRVNEVRCNARAIVATELEGQTLRELPTLKIVPATDLPAILQPGRTYFYGCVSFDAAAAARLLAARTPPPSAGFIGPTAEATAGVLRLFPVQLLVEVTIRASPALHGASHRATAAACDGALGAARLALAHIVQTLTLQFEPPRIAHEVPLRLALAPVTPLSAVTATAAAAKAAAKAAHSSNTTDMVPWLRSAFLPPTSVPAQPLLVPPAAHLLNVVLHVGVAYEFSFPVANPFDVPLAVELVGPLPVRRSPADARDFLASAAGTTTSASSAQRDDMSEDGSDGEGAEVGGTDVLRGSWELHTFDLECGDMAAPATGTDASVPIEPAAYLWPAIRPSADPAATAWGNTAPPGVSCRCCPIAASHDDVQLSPGDQLAPDAADLPCCRCCDYAGALPSPTDATPASLLSSLIIANGALLTSDTAVAPASAPARPAPPHTAAGPSMTSDGSGRCPMSQQGMPARSVAQAVAAMMQRVAQRAPAPMSLPGDLNFFAAPAASAAVDPGPALVSGPPGLPAYFDAGRAQLGHALSRLPRSSFARRIHYWATELQADGAGGDDGEKTSPRAVAQEWPLVLHCPATPAAVHHGSSSPAKSMTVGAGCFVGTPFCDANASRSIGGLFYAAAGARSRLVLQPHEQGVLGPWMVATTAATVRTRRTSPGFDRSGFWAGMVLATNASTALPMHVRFESVSIAIALDLRDAALLLLRPPSEAPVFLAPPSLPAPDAADPRCAPPPLVVLPGELFRNTSSEHTSGASPRPPSVRSEPLLVWYVPSIALRGGTGAEHIEERTLVFRNLGGDSAEIALSLEDRCSSNGFSLLDPPCAPAEIARPPARSGAPAFPARRLPAGASAGHPAAGPRGVALLTVPAHGNASARIGYTAGPTAWAAGTTLWVTTLPDVAQQRYALVAFVPPNVLAPPALADYAGAADAAASATAWTRQLALLVHATAGVLIVAAIAMRLVPGIGHRLARTLMVLLPRARRSARRSSLAAAAAGTAVPSGPSTTTAAATSARKQGHSPSLRIAASPQHPKGRYHSPLPGMPQAHAGAPLLRTLSESPARHRPVRRSCGGARASHGDSPPATSPRAVAHHHECDPTAPSAFLSVDNNGDDTDGSSATSTSRSPPPGRPVPSSFGADAAGSAPPAAAMFVRPSGALPFAFARPGDPSTAAAAALDVAVAAVTATAFASRHGGAVALTGVGRTSVANAAAALAARLAEAREGRLPACPPVSGTTADADATLAAGLLRASGAVAPRSHVAASSTSALAALVAASSQFDGSPELRLSPEVHAAALKLIAALPLMSACQAQQPCTAHAAAASAVLGGSPPLLTTEVGIAQAKATPLGEPPDAAAALPPLTCAAPAPAVAQPVNVTSQFTRLPPAAPLVGAHATAAAAAAAPPPVAKVDTVAGPVARAASLAPAPEKVIVPQDAASDSPEETPAPASTTENEPSTVERRYLAAAASPAAPKAKQCEPTITTTPAIAPALPIKEVFSVAPAPTPSASATVDAVPPIAAAPAAATPAAAAGLKKVTRRSSSSPPSTSSPVASSDGATTGARIPASKSSAGRRRGGGGGGGGSPAEAPLRRDAADDALTIAALAAALAGVDSEPDGAPDGTAAVTRGTKARAKARRTSKRSPPGIAASVLTAAVNAGAAAAPGARADSASAAGAGGHDVHITTLSPSPLAGSVDGQLAGAVPAASSGQIEVSSGQMAPLPTVESGNAFTSPSEQLSSPVTVPTASTATATTTAVAPTFSRAKKKKRVAHQAPAPTSCTPPIPSAAEPGLSTAPASAPPAVAVESSSNPTLANVSSREVTAAAAGQASAPGEAAPVVADRTMPASVAASPTSPCPSLPQEAAAAVTPPTVASGDLPEPFTSQKSPSPIAGLPPEQEVLHTTGTPSEEVISTARPATDATGTPVAAVVVVTAPVTGPPTREIVIPASASLPVADMPPTVPPARVAAIVDISAVRAAGALQATAATNKVSEPNSGVPARPAPPPSPLAAKATVPVSSQPVKLACKKPASRAVTPSAAVIAAAAAAAADSAVARPPPKKSYGTPSTDAAMPVTTSPANSLAASASGCTASKGPTALQAHQPALARLNALETPSPATMDATTEPPLADAPPQGPAADVGHPIASAAAVDDAGIPAQRPSVASSAPAPEKPTDATAVATSSLPTAALIAGSSSSSAEIPAPTAPAAVPPASVSAASFATTAPPIFALGLAGGSGGGGGGTTVGTGGHVAPAPPGAAAAATLAASPSGTLLPVATCAAKPSQPQAKEQAQLHPRQPHHADGGPARSAAGVPQPLACAASAAPVNMEGGASMATTTASTSSASLPDLAARRAGIRAPKGGPASIGGAAAPTTGAGAGDSEGKGAPAAVGTPTSTKESRLTPFAKAFLGRQLREAAKASAARTAPTVPRSTGSTSAAAGPASTTVVLKSLDVPSTGSPAAPAATGTNDRAASSPALLQGFTIAANSPAVADARPVSALATQTTALASAAPLTVNAAAPCATDTPAAATHAANTPMPPPSPPPPPVEPSGERAREPPPRPAAYTASHAPPPGWPRRNSATPPAAFEAPPFSSSLSPPHPLAAPPPLPLPLADSATAIGGVPVAQIGLAMELLEYQRAAVDERIQQLVVQRAAAEGPVASGASAGVDGRGGGVGSDGATNEAEAEEAWCEQQLTEAQAQRTQLTAALLFLGYQLQSGLANQQYQTLLQAAAMALAQQAASNSTTTAAVGVPTSAASDDSVTPQHLLAAVAPTPIDAGSARPTPLLDPAHGIPLAPVSPTGEAPTPRSGPSHSRTSPSPRSPSPAAVLSAAAPSAATLPIAGSDQHGCAPHRRHHHHALLHDGRDDLLGGALRTSPPTTPCSPPASPPRDGGGVSTGEAPQHSLSSSATSSATASPMVTPGAAAAAAAVSFSLGLSLLPTVTGATAVSSTAQLPPPAPSSTDALMSYFGALVAQTTQTQGGDPASALMGTGGGAVAAVRRWRTGRDEGPPGPSPSVPVSGPVGLPEIQQAVRRFQQAQAEAALRAVAACNEPGSSAQTPSPATSPYASPGLGPVAEWDEAAAPWRSPSAAPLLSHVLLRQQARLQIQQQQQQQRQQYEAYSMLLQQLAQQQPPAPARMTTYQSPSLTPVPPPGGGAAAAVPPPLFSLAPVAHAHAPVPAPAVSDIPAATPAPTDAADVSLLFLQHLQSSQPAQAGGEASSGPWAFAAAPTPLAPSSSFSLSGTSVVASAPSAPAGAVPTLRLPGGTSATSAAPRALPSYMPLAVTNAADSATAVGVDGYPPPPVLLSPSASAGGVPASLLSVPSTPPAPPLLPGNLDGRRGGFLGGGEDPLSLFAASPSLYFSTQITSPDIGTHRPTHRRAMPPSPVVASSVSAGDAITASPEATSAVNDSRGILLEIDLGTRGRRGMAEMAEPPAFFEPGETEKPPPLSPSAMPLPPDERPRDQQQPPPSTNQS